jgi:hypothetical protein
MTISITKLSIMYSSTTLSDIYAECHVLHVVILSVTLLNVITLSSMSPFHKTFYGVIN